MTYRDNEVKFEFQKYSDYKLVGGKYTINDFCITSGQDPDGHIKIGMVSNFGEDGKMVFSIGRKGSESTAKWCNDRLDATQNTFGHDAGELNFAFMGTLELVVAGGQDYSEHQTFIFSNIAIAQGHAGLSNNWWFGGKTCIHIDDNRVRAYGKTSKGSVISFIFLRGGNDVSTIDMDFSGLVATANWMRKLSDDIKLNQIVMPGSHDAGMSELHHCAPLIGAGGYTQTQSGSIEQQLMYGSRYFDIRVDYDHKELVTYHRGDVLGIEMGCNGQSLKSILDTTRDFLKTYKTEIAILKFSHIRKTNGHDAADTKCRIDELLNAYSDVIYVDSNSNVNLSKLDLKSVRGKMILVFDYSEHISQPNGRFRYKDYNKESNSNGNIYVYDKYADTSNYEEMKANQIKKWNEFGGLDKEYLFLLSWTLTAKLGSPSIQTLAEEANSKLPAVLHDQIILQGTPRPNIVYIDYVNPDTTSAIIQYNFK